MTARLIQSVKAALGHRLARGLARLHRDQGGWTMLDYAMVFAFVVVPIILLFDKMFEIITGYFSMIAFYVTWPFL
jgi:Flp pilus assembly pilin Flp